MNAHDEEIQKAFEEGRKPAHDGSDTRAYGAVFQNLRKEPGYALPPGFAECVCIAAFEAAKRHDRKDYYWFIAGIVFLTVSFTATIAYTGFKLDLGFLSHMADYRGLAVFGAVFILFLNWLDKRLIRAKHPVY